jgi:RNA polymerase sigma-70 factor (ECF subfamily)
VLDTDASAALDSLLLRCAAGDRAAFRQVYDLQSPKLYAVALRITRRANLAADAVQEAFLQVWQNAGHFDPKRGKAEAWLIGLARYRALDLVRVGSRELSGIELPEQVDETPTPLEQVTMSYETEALRRCLGTLDPDKRRMIELAFVGGHSHGELADRLGIPLGTVKSWIRRGLEALKRCFGP